MIRICDGATSPEPMDHNPADDAAPCEWPGCDLLGHNVVDGLPYCDKHAAEAADEETV